MTKIVATLTAQQLAVLNYELGQAQHAAQAATLKQAAVVSMMKMVVPGFNPQKHAVDTETGNVVMDDDVVGEIPKAPDSEIIVMPPGPQLVQ